MLLFSGASSAVRHTQLSNLRLQMLGTISTRRTRMMRNRRREGRKVKSKRRREGKQEEEAVAEKEEQKKQRRNFGEEENGDDDQGFRGYDIPDINNTHTICVITKFSKKHGDNVDQ
ncbi:hypothetical protein M9H77_12192 [Catharanthus roseus]|uniref:Uncharacterized protein n=1 Tax=Catharanthus roseus TaxID=4058 RepID=A0ACC0BGX3_CATRO|nr:hypothetical protein M9H77_12192 [Catharanthus roseus]